MSNWEYIFLSCLKHLPKKTNIREISNTEMLNICKKL